MTWSWFALVINVLSMPRDAGVVGCARRASEVTAMVAVKKIFAFTISILAARNYGGNRKLHLVANPISDYVRFRQWSLPSPATAGKTALTGFRANDSCFRSNAQAGVLLCLITFGSASVRRTFFKTFGSSPQSGWR